MLDAMHDLLVLSSQLLPWDTRVKCCLHILHSKGVASENFLTFIGTGGGAGAGAGGGAGAGAGGGGAGGGGAGKLLAIA